MSRKPKQIRCHLCHSDKHFSDQCPTQVDMFEGFDDLSPVKRTVDFLDAVREAMVEGDETDE